jgi:hypothetical protein
MANWVQKADLDPQDFLTAGPAAAGSIKINPASPTLAGLGGGGAVLSVEGQTGNVDLKTVGGQSLVGPGDIPLPAAPVLSVEGQIGNVDLKTVGGTSLVGPGDIPFPVLSVEGQTGNIDLKTVGGVSLIGPGDIPIGGGGAVTSVEGQTGNVDLKTVGGISLVGPGDIPFPADAVLSVEGQTGNVDLKTVGGTSLVGPGDIAFPVLSVEGQTGNVDLKTVGGISLVGPGDIPFPADAVLSVEGQTGNVDLKTVGGTSLVGPGDIAFPVLSVEGQTGNVDLKTVNGISLVGPGDIVIAGGGGTAATLPEAEAAAVTTPYLSPGILGDALSDKVGGVNQLQTDAYTGVRFAGVAAYDGEVANEAARLALPVADTYQGDYAYQTDSESLWFLKGTDSTVATDWVNLGYNKIQVGKYTDMLAAPTANLVVGKSKYFVYRPDQREGNYTWQGVALGWVRDVTYEESERNSILAMVEIWMSRPHQSRALAAFNGAIPQYRRLLGRDFYGIVPATNTHAALVAALATAAAAVLPHQRVVVLREDTALTANITMPDNVHLVSPHGAQLSGAFELWISSGCAVVGVKFNGTRIVYNLASGVKRSIIAANQFVNVGGTGAIFDPGTVDGTFHQHNVVVMNEFIGCSYAQLGNRHLRLYVAGNKATNVSGVGRGWQFYGLHDSVIEYNVVVGGIVGIGFLADRTLSRGITGNTLRRNLLSDVSEESMTIDCYGNIPAKMSTIDTVNAVGSSGTPAAAPTIIITRPDNSNIGPYDHMVQFIDGPLVGDAFPIVAATTLGGGQVGLQIPNNSITTAKLAAAGGANSRVSIVVMAMHNSFVENIIVNGHLTGIAAWGLGYELVIAHNVINMDSAAKDAIYVASLSGMAPSSQSAPYAARCIAAPARCQVTGNNILRGKIHFFGHGFTATAADTESVVAPMPHFDGGNSVVSQKDVWFAPIAGWTGSEQVAAVTTLAGTYDDNDYAIQQLGYDLSTALKSNFDDEKQGVFTANGGGTVFTIPHGLTETPQVVHVTPRSAGAAGNFYATADGDNITVTYLAATPGGANNVLLNWRVLGGAAI